jgi:hypothetical protein
MLGAGLRLAALVLTVLGLGLIPSRCRADDSPAKTPPTKPATTKETAAKSTAVNAAPATPATAAPTHIKPKPAKAATPLSAEREAAVLAFAREQHPELATLIAKLRTDNRTQFDRALRQLAQDRERLVRLKQVSPPQYDLGLAAWKLDSRAHLLAARMTMSQDPALEAELKQVLRERVDVRLKQLQFERGRLQDRLAQVKTSIQGIEADKEAAADKDLQRIKRSVARNRRPAARKPASDETKSTSAARPVVAQRPRIPAEKTAASVTQPTDGGANVPSKTKQD